MNLFTNLLLLLLVFCLISGQQQTNATAIKYKNIVNKEGVSVFEIVEENHIEISNVYRGPDEPSIKFSLEGVQIANVNAREDWHWQLVLSNSRVVDLFYNNISGSESETEYLVSWPVDGTAGAEVCFHYAHNNAYW